MTGMKIFFFAWGVAFSGAIMPGPLLTVNIKESLQKGFWVGPKLIMGHALLEAALVVALFFGLDSVIDLPISRAIISCLGGLFLFRMAYDMMFKERKKGIRLETDGSEAADDRGLPLVLAGVLVSLANPYWTIWWATLGLGFLVQARVMGPTGIVLFYFGHILADFLWYSLVSWVVSKGKTFFSPRLYRGVIIVCAVFLFYLSIDFLCYGARLIGVFS